ncbi:MAG: oligosaccharide flippase family protein [Rhodospirillaceae bacterium]|nr:oligosaccharide flippase family protein [Rhodospirillaceae bacterium]
MVVGILVFNVTYFALSYVLHPFRPRLDLSRVGEMWAFSFWSLMHTIFEYLADQIDTLIVGRFKSTREVGLYNVAHDVAASPLVELSQPMSRVLMPAYVKIMDDRDELSRIFAKVFSGVALLAFSVGAGVTLIAHDAVAVILGAQWAECAPLMQILAPASAMFAMSFPIYALLTVAAAAFAALLLRVSAADVGTAVLAALALGALGEKTARVAMKAWAASLIGRAASSVRRRAVAGPQRLMMPLVSVVAMISRRKRCSPISRA